MRYLQQVPVCCTRRGQRHPKQQRELQFSRERWNDLHVKLDDDDTEQARQHPILSRVEWNETTLQNAMDRRIFANKHTTASTC